MNKSRSAFDKKKGAPNTEKLPRTMQITELKEIRSVASAPHGHFDGGIGGRATRR